MTTVLFWSSLTSIAAFLESVNEANNRMLAELAKEVRNASPQHRKRVSEEMSTIIGKLTELKKLTDQAVPPTLVAGEMAHQSENAPS
jgi:hypothetical protein